MRRKTKRIIDIGTRHILVQLAFLLLVILFILTVFSCTGQKIDKDFKTSFILVDDHKDTRLAKCAYATFSRTFLEIYIAHVHSVVIIGKPPCKPIKGVDYTRLPHGFYFFEDVNGCYRAAEGWGGTDTDSNVLWLR